MVMHSSSLQWLTDKIIERNLKVRNFHFPKDAEEGAEIVLLINTFINCVNTFNIFIDRLILLLIDQYFHYKIIW